MRSSKNASLKRFRPAASRLGLWQRRLLYLSYSVLFASGLPGLCGWQAAAAMAMRFHGAAAMAFLVVLGSLLQHVQAGWAARSNRESGIAMLAFFSVLALTGWLLYYGPDGGLREAGKALHLGLGAMSPVLLFVHVVLEAKRQ